MRFLTNPHRGLGLPTANPQVENSLRHDPTYVGELLARCPAAAVTPLVDCPALASALGLGHLWIKDERARMGLGSFKALGAAFAIAKAAHQKLGDRVFADGQAGRALVGTTYVAATAGNHGLSIAAGARVFGANAVIYVAETVPQGFVDRLLGYGAEVVRAGEDYAGSLVAAKDAAAKNGWHLLSDTSWPGYTKDPLDIMEGYLAMAAEAVEQMDQVAALPTHVFLQAGVGGLAAAVAIHLRHQWGESPLIYVVEPVAAPALQASILAGKPIIADGPVSNMGRLDCKEPSHLALDCLAKAADGFLTLDDDFVATAIVDLADAGMATSPSGGAGYAGLKAAAALGVPGLDDNSRVLLILSEGPSGD